MKRALLADEIRRVDRIAQDSFGLPPSILMERAGSRVADEALEMAGSLGRVFVLCGLGNNGGDGLVAARRLVQAGRRVEVELVGASDRLQGEPLRNLRLLEGAGVRPSPIAREGAVGFGDVVVDALLGTGLARGPDGAFADAISRIESWRNKGAKVLSVDVPSGLSSDTGRPFPVCVRADRTVALGSIKVGQVLEPGASLCGEIRNDDLGIPGAVLQAIEGPGVFLVEEEDARGRLPPRRLEGHKGDFGHLLVVAGSPGRTGAAALAGLGALRSGAGLVTVATRSGSLAAVLSHAPELMGVGLGGEGPLGPGDLDSLLQALEGKQAVVIGPGIPRGEETFKCLGAFLEEVSVPCVVDADALNALAGHLELLSKAGGPLLLTPHPGEMGRLLGKTAREVQEDRVAAGRALATRYEVDVVLKGARTLVCLPDGRTFVNPTGNPGMATAGSGDVLSGVLGALLAQGLAPEDAALAAVFAHGLSGDLAAARKGQLGLVASDLICRLPEVWVKWGR